MEKTYDCNFIFSLLYKLGDSLREWENRVIKRIGQEETPDRTLNLLFPNPLWF